MALCSKSQKRTKYNVDVVPSMSHIPDYIMALNLRYTNISYTKYGNININIAICIELLILDIIGPITHQGVMANYQTAITRDIQFVCGAWFVIGLMISKDTCKH